MTEEQLQRAVIEAAQILGWRVAHFRPAKTAKGWRTAVSADGAGFPDLVLVRETLLMVELKAAGGKLSDRQIEWLNALDRAFVDVRVWTPLDWESGHIERVLRGRGRATSPGNSPGQPEEGAGHTSVAHNRGAGSSDVGAGRSPSRGAKASVDRSVRVGGRDLRDGEGPQPPGLASPLEQLRRRLRLVHSDLAGRPTQGLSEVPVERNPEAAVPGVPHRPAEAPLLGLHRERRIPVLDERSLRWT